MPKNRRAIASHQNKLMQAAIGWLLLFAILTTTIIPTWVGAQDERVTVRLDGRSVFRISAVENNDAQARARQIERRMNRLLENPEAIAPPRIETTRTDRSERVITIAGVPVVTVTSADAQDNLTTVDALASQWSQAINAALKRASRRRLSPWGRFVAEVQASVATAFGRLLESAIAIVPRAIASGLVIGLFWAIATSVRWLMRIIFRHIVEDLTVENLIKQVAYYAVWTLGVIVALDAFGFDPRTVATGLGLTGLALGFALKDILSNFVSGILILILRPFELGDQIVVGETEGNVERIELRATQLRTYDGRVVLVPNAEVFTSRIINNTAAPIRRSSVELFIGYDSDLQKVVNVVTDAAQSAAGVLAEPRVSVRIRELGQDDVAIEVRFWTDSRRSDFVATTSAVRMAIVGALKQVGIGLPDPDVRILVPRYSDKWQDAFGVGNSSQSHNSES
ncbi:mechanosensitive ion channel family protein [Chroococcidiopsis sp. FACHB-1243]|uniref:mechanosensitive ion channel family protein n=1 Tax=Chroococcidiopsis sp. [FACHB-1243] TaxID=2692781 RepID=UPI0017859D5D|nr:mechanosensitive ion channel family protein [Chroococcidiopsis sp. [FACHB-1243]]MBD2307232.1 mechanosensitive ion channel family protein [Chroococcidiopsis sp. [FACHB-1243]]